MRQKTIGEVVSVNDWVNIHDEKVNAPQEGTLTHIQFRRFAGCPVCNLHLQSFFKRSEELKAHHVKEVIVFHASKRSMLENVLEVPFDLIADPTRKYYKSFGVESSWKALCGVSVIVNAVKGIVKFGLQTPQSLEAELGLPADFLIDDTGKIVALKYGEHANDQWSVDEVLDLAKSR